MQNFCPYKLGLKDYTQTYTHACIAKEAMYLRKTHTTLHSDVV